MSVKILVKVKVIFKLTKAIIIIIKAWIVLEILIQAISVVSIWTIILLGLKSMRSKLPSIIRLSNWSIPLANTSLMEKPNWTIENVSKIS